MPRTGGGLVSATVQVGSGAMLSTWSPVTEQVEVELPSSTVISRSVDWMDATPTPSARLSQSKGSPVVGVGIPGMGLVPEAGVQRAQVDPPSVEYRTVASSGSESGWL